MDPRDWYYMPPRGFSPIFAVHMPVLILPSFVSSEWTAAWITTDEYLKIIKRGRINSFSVLEIRVQTSCLVYNCVTKKWRITQNSPEGILGKSK